MIRNATLDDIPVLIAIEELSWKPNLRASVDSIRQRISRYPLGQYVVEVDGLVKGVLYTQRVCYVNDIVSKGFAGQACLHDPTGEYVQLLAINVPSGKHAYFNALTDIPITHNNLTLCLSSPICQQS